MANNVDTIRMATLRMAKKVEILKKKNLQIVTKLLSTNCKFTIEFWIQNCFQRMTWWCLTVFNTYIFSTQLLQLFGITFNKILKIKSEVAFLVSNKDLWNIFKIYSLWHLLKKQTDLKWDTKWILDFWIILNSVK